MPRITISLPDDQYDALRTLSRLQGRPISKVINELVDLTFPSVVRITQVMSAVENFTDEQKQAMQKALNDADEQLQGISPVVSDLFAGLEEVAGTKTPSV